MAKTNTMVTLGVIALIVIAIAFAYTAFGGVGQTALPGQTNAGAGSVGYISTGSTALTVIGTDAKSPGTAVSGTTLVSTDGANFVTGTFSISASPNQELDILVVNNTAYHNALVKGFKVPFSPTGVVNQPLFANGSVSISIFNTDAVKVTGSAVNQSVTTGGAYNMKIRMDGTDKKTSGDLRCVLESSDKTKSDAIVLSGLTGASLVGTSVPSSYSSTSGSQTVVYDMPAIVGAVSPEGTIAVSSKSGQSLAGKNVKITCFSKEHFLDSATGKVAYDIEDSLGTLKSMASYTATVYFT